MDEKVMTTGIVEEMDLWGLGGVMDYYFNY
jgi:hypothetical protein